MAERLRLALSLGNRNNASEPAMVVVAGDFNIGPEHQMMAPIYALGLRHVFNPHRAANLTMCTSPPPNACSAAAAAAAAAGPVQPLSRLGLF